MEKTEFYSAIEQVFALNGVESHATEPNKAAFFKMCEFMLQTNQHMNVTAITDTYGVVEKHLCDSLTAARYIPSGAKLLDVGCGGGFPSLPLAIARQDLRITSLDSTAKKVEYVRKSAENLNLHNISTISGRAEELAHNQDMRETFDVVTARAVANLPVLCELCLPFVKKGGVFVSMKANISEDEIKDSGSAIKKLGGDLENIEINRFELVLHDGSCEQRTILVIKKIAPTPTDLPRHYSKIKSKRL